VSATNAAVHQGVDKRFVPEDMEVVLKGLKEVFNMARHNAVNQHYR
jgi:hypothetical protein